MTKTLLGVLASAILFFSQFAEAQCSSDLNEDSEVNSVDMGLMLLEWGPVIESINADINHDQVVDSTDLAILLNEYGNCSGINVIEIDDSVLETVYYHKTSFLSPTKLVFKNLKSVNGYLYFYHTNNIVEIDFPVLENAQSYVYVDGNISLVKFSSPKLDSIARYLYVQGNTNLQVLDICNLKHIFCEGQEPYFYIQGNTGAVDAVQPCFAATLHGTVVITTPITVFSDNTAIGGGSFEVECGFAHETGVCWSTTSGPTRNDFHAASITYGQSAFTANLTNLLPNTTYYVRAYSGEIYGNQISFTTAGSSSGINVIEIDDSVLETVYYHKTSFLSPTKLVFKNLKSVNGYLYFYHTNNIVEIDFPVLENAQSYVYVDGNISLVKFSSPKLDSIARYLYVQGNTNLQVLDICNLKHIFCEGQEPYFYIQGNTGAVDAVQPCFAATLHGCASLTTPQEQEPFILQSAEPATPVLNKK